MSCQLHAIIIFGKNGCISNIIIQKLESSLYFGKEGIWIGWEAVEKKAVTDNCSRTDLFSIQLKYDNIHFPFILWTAVYGRYLCIFHSSSIL